MAHFFIIKFVRRRKVNFVQGNDTSIARTLCPVMFLYVVYQVKRGERGSKYAQLNLQIITA